MSNPDWITYVPRRVYDAARRLEAACERCGGLSSELVAEYRSDFRSTLAGRVLWQRWSRIFDQFAAGLSYRMGFISGGGFQVRGPTIICLARRQQPMG